MKHLPLILLSVAGGIVGAYLFSAAPDLRLGATVARTTITNPWTFSSTTIFNARATVTTTNSATSTLIVGCVQTYATSTETPWKSRASSTATIEGVDGVMVLVYGACP